MSPDGVRWHPYLGPTAGCRLVDFAQAIGEHFEELEVLPLVPTGYRSRRVEAKAFSPRKQVCCGIGVTKGCRGPQRERGSPDRAGRRFSSVQGTVVESGRRVRGVRGRTVSFELELLPSATAIRSKTRGFKLKKLLKPLKVIVFKFLAEVAVGQVVKRFERDVSTGLVLIRSSEPTVEWAAGPAVPTLPKGQPARVLLLVHGTFSSTEGGDGHRRRRRRGDSFSIEL